MTEGAPAFTSPAHNAAFQADVHATGLPAEAPRTRGLAADELLRYQSYVAPGMRAALDSLADSNHAAAVSQSAQSALTANPTAGTSAQTGDLAPHEYPGSANGGFRYHRHAADGAWKAALDKGAGSLSPLAQARPTPSRWHSPATVLAAERIAR